MHTFQCDDLAGGVHDRRVGRDGPPDGVGAVVHVDNHHLGRVAHRLPHADVLVRLHGEGAEPNVGRIDSHILELKFERDKCDTLSFVYQMSIATFLSIKSLGHLGVPSTNRTRGPKGHISYTRVQYATFLTDQPGRQFLFTHWPENTKLVEDVEILLPVKFHWIQFSSFREEVENVSANQTPVRPSCFSHQPEKHKLDRGHWYLASCQVSLNSVQRFQRRSRKCAVIGKRFLPNGPFSAFFNDFEIVNGPFLINLHRLLWAIYQVNGTMAHGPLPSQSLNVSANQRPGRPSCFSDQPENDKLGRGCWDLASCHVLLNSFQRFQRRSWKCELTTYGRTTDNA